MSEWQKVAFDELFLVPTRNGIYKSAEFHGRGTKIVNMGELFANDRIGEQSMERIELTEKEKQIALLQEGDLLFARRSLVESGAGKAAIVMGLSEETTFESSVIRVRLDPARCNPLFYLYWLRSYNGRSAILPLVTGVNVKGIRGSDLAKIMVDYPEIEIQNRISAVLSAYDDLIKNNQSQIELLEETARRLYKEWFVDLRYPGYENVAKVNGVPEGWDKKKVTDLLQIKYGKDHKALEDGSIPVYGSGGIMRKVKPILYSGESVLIPRKGSLNNILYVDGDFWTIDTMFYSVPLMNNIAKYTYLFLSRLDMYSFNIGAAVPSMTINILDGIDILLPDKDTLLKFESCISVLFERIKLLRKQIEVASESRDRLLPKLMSGEITV